MQHIKILIPVLLLLLLQRTAVAQPITVEGNVLLSGSNAPAAQAIVDFTGPDRARAVTIDDGTFYISRLEAGTYQVVITYQGNVKKPFSMSVYAGASFRFYIDP